MNLKAVAVLLLAVTLLSGCSGNKPSKTEQPPAASPIAQPSMTPTPAAAPSPSPSPTPAATKPPVKAAAKAAKAAKKEKQYTGSPTDQLAQCMTDKGAVMYGVFWCDHCRMQKEIFGDSFKYVKYVECVTQDKPRELIPECKAQGISHTPTWIFADGTRMEGSKSLATLAEATGCKAP